MIRGKILKDSKKGQSLVEVAFALPMLLMLMVGIVELGFALYAHEHTINAAREGARLGSMGGSNQDITFVVHGAPSGLIDYRDYGDGGDDGTTDLYVARGRVSDDCSQILDFSGWEQELDTPSFDTTPVAEGEVLAWFQEQGYTNCGFPFVAVDLHYRSPSFLRLPMVRQLSEAVPMRSLAVMRIEGPRPSICLVYPIAVHESSLKDDEGEWLKEGDIVYDIFNGLDFGNFGWLRWPDDSSGGSAQALQDALTDPSNSGDFQNAVDPNDNDLDIGDWVWGNTGLSNSDDARDALDSLVGQYIRIIVWDESAGTGSNGMYHVVNFAIVELIDYHLPGTNTITARFIGFDTDAC